MTDYRDRQIDLALSELLGGDRPPDQADAILAAAERERQSAFSPNGVLNGTRTDAISTTDKIGQPTRLPPQSGRLLPSRWSSWGVPALAASLAIAAGLLAFWFWPRVEQASPDRDRLALPRPAPFDAGSEELRPASLVTRDGFVMPPETEMIELLGQRMLRDGWLLTGREATSLLVGLSPVEFRDARAVVVMGQVPTAYEAVAISRQLAASNVINSEGDLSMIRNTRNWFAGLGMAVCMLSGSALIGDDEVRSPSDDETITIKQVFDRVDVNDDGVISMEECVCEHSKKFDADQDGRITRNEFASGVVAACGSEKDFIQLVSDIGGVDSFYAAAKAGTLPKIAESSLESVFAFLDKDESGLLEKAECICKGSQSSDANQDGVVTIDELRATAIEFFGSEKAFVSVVRQKGGVEAFFSAMNDAESSSPSSLVAVFNCYDKDGSGTLEPAECICQGSKMADVDGDGKVTKEELAKVAETMFGSVEKFESYISKCGGAKEFYAAVASGKLKAHDHPSHLHQRPEQKQHEPK